MAAISLGCCVGKHTIVRIPLRFALRLSPRCLQTHQYSKLSPDFDPDAPIKYTTSKAYGYLGYDTFSPSKSAKRGPWYEPISVFGSTLPIVATPSSLHQHFQLSRRITGNTPDDGPFSGAPLQEVTSELSASQYEDVADATLDSLAMHFDNLVDDATLPSDADIELSSGVLTAKLGTGLGTYVINKQTPNKQIWLSSPISGPKRYDFKSEEWRYKYETMSLHKLLSTELSKSLEVDVDFSACEYAKQR